MHTIKLSVGDSVYSHLMFLLNNLKTDEIKIVEDIAQSKDESSSAIDMSKYDVEAFKAIQDPLKWQQDIRAEWN